MQSRLEMSLHALEILPRIERGRALDPRVNRVAGDDVDAIGPIKARGDLTGVIIRKACTGWIGYSSLFLGQIADDSL